jgi:hypothetical protein
MAAINYQIWRSANEGWVHPAANFAVSGLAQPGAPLIRALQITLDAELQNAGAVVLYEVRMNGQWQQGLRTDGRVAGLENEMVRIDQIKVALANLNNRQVIYQIFAPGVGWLGNSGENSIGANGGVAGRPGRFITAIKIGLQ